MSTDGLLLSQFVRYRSVPYDPYLPFVFQGEEFLQSIRAFTYGYDFYAPLRNIAFHIYARRDNVERQNIHTFGENEFIFPGVKKLAYLRLIAISGTTKPALDYFSLEEENYGLGQVRTRKQFFELFGIHPDTRIIEGGLCDFVRGAFGVKSSMHYQFSPFLRYDKMGIDYSRIQYQHKTPVKSDTVIDPKELAHLREKLRGSDRGTTD